MNIDHVRSAREAGTVTLSAAIGGHPVWLRFPADAEISERGDWLLAAALQPAMAQREALELPKELPVSPRLLAGAETLQEIFCTWFEHYRKIDIRASAAIDDRATTRTASFFSGGVDGSYTLVKHHAEIDDLLFVQGIDMQEDNDGLAAEVVAVNSKLAASQGKRLIPIVSNIRKFAGHFGVRWNTYNGAGLAAIALASSHRKTYIAASHTYAELFPWGSHPLVDSLFSTEATEFVHDGAEARRSEKLLAISQYPEILAGLRVCWQDTGYNCQTCEKCLRTRLALRLLNLTSPSLEPLVDLAPIGKLTIWDDSELTFFEDNARLARSVGDGPAVAALRKCLAHYWRRHAVRTVDRHLLGGALGRMRNVLGRGAKP